MKAAHATNASDPDLKNIFREKPMHYGQKKLFRSLEKNIYRHFAPLKAGNFDV